MVNVSKIVIGGQKYTDDILRKAHSLVRKSNEELFTTKGSNIIDDCIQGTEKVVDMPNDVRGLDTWHNHLPGTSVFFSEGDYFSFFASGEKRMHLIAGDELRYIEIPNKPHKEVYIISRIFNNPDYKKLFQELPDGFSGKILKPWNEIVETAKQEGWIAGAKKWKEIFAELDGKTKLTQVYTENGLIQQLQRRSKTADFFQESNYKKLIEFLNKEQNGAKITLGQDGDVLVTKVIGKGERANLNKPFGRNQSIVDAIKRKGSEYNQIIRDALLGA